MGGPIAPPIHATGIDYFGPILVSRGRAKFREKRYGVVFTCLASRALHLEVAHSLSTDSFIDALRRFFPRRGKVSHYYPDNGTNLVGGCRELREAIDHWNSDSLNIFMLLEKITWNFNPPSASHRGGVWERGIRIVRRAICIPL